MLCWPFLAVWLMVSIGLSGSVLRCGTVGLPLTDGNVLS